MLRVARRVHRDVHSSRRTPRQPHETMKNARMTGCDACTTMNLYLVANSISLPLRVSRCTAVHAPRCGFLRKKTRVHHRARLPLHPLLYYQITRYRSTIKIFELFIIFRVCVCTYMYIYIYLHDIRRRHGYCWWSSNPKPRPREQATEFNAGLRVPALNKLDIVILKERRTNHGGLIFSCSRF